MDSVAPYALVAGRILLSLIFLMSGLGKLADPSGTMQYIESVSMPLPTLAYAVALVCEIGGGLAVLVGFYTRVAAAVLAVFTLVSASFFHTHFADPDQMIHFMKNVAMAGGFLCLAASGAGALSIDAVAAGRRTRHAAAG